MLLLEGHRSPHLLLPASVWGWRQTTPPKPTPLAREGSGTGMPQLCRLFPILRRGCRCISIASSHPARPAAPLLFRFPGATTARGWGSQPHRHGDIIRHRQPRELTSLRRRGRRSRNSREGLNCWWGGLGGLRFGGLGTWQGAAEGSRASCPMLCPVPTGTARAEDAAGGVSPGDVAAWGAARSPAARPWVPGCCRVPPRWFFQGAPPP